MKATLLKLKPFSVTLNKVNSSGVGRNGLPHSWHSVLHFGWTATSGRATEEVNHELSMLRKVAQKYGQSSLKVAKSYSFQGKESLLTYFSHIPRNQLWSYFGRN